MEITMIYVNMCLHWDDLPILLQLGGGGGGGESKGKRSIVACLGFIKGCYCVITSVLVTIIIYIKFHFTP